MTYFDKKKTEKKAHQRLLSSRCRQQTRRSHRRQDRETQMLEKNEKIC